MATMAIQNKHAGPIEVLSREPIASHRKGASKRASAALWGIQGLLAFLFLFAGGMKLALPMEALAAMAPLPGLFLKFVGLAEVTGAVGLILPGLLRKHTTLTPLAAAGLVSVMVGATVVTAITGPAAAAALPLLVGILAASIAYGRAKQIRAARQY